MPPNKGMNVCSSKKGNGRLGTGKPAGASGRPVRVRFNNVKQKEERKVEMTQGRNYSKGAFTLGIQRYEIRKHSIARGSEWECNWMTVVRCHGECLR